MKEKSSDIYLQENGEDRLEKEAQRIIRKYVIVATGTGFLNKPVLCAASIAGTQLLMVNKLCQLFEISFEKQWVRVSIQSVTSSVLTQVLVMGITNIPGMGRIAKGFSGASIAGLYTATVGEYYKVHFQNGGNLQNASLAKVGNYFLEEYERGDINFRDLGNPLAIIDRMFIR